MFSDWGELQLRTANQPSMVLLREASSVAPMVNIASIYGSPSSIHGSINLFRSRAELVLPVPQEKDWGGRGLPKGSEGQGEPLGPVRKGVSSLLSTVLYGLMGHLTRLAGVGRGRQLDSEDQAMMWAVLVEECL
eukprot:13292058-Alexandrium_andersonii.AAC.1